jgi:hypothetical protein
VIEDVDPRNREFYALFDRLNHTELYQLARSAGHVVMPNLARDALIRIIIHDREAPAIDEHTFDEWRLAIMRFIIDHRRVLETQITCPARTFQPDACFGCIDTQVVSCLVGNSSNLPLIQLHRKARRDQ